MDIQPIVICINGFQATGDYNISKHKKQNLTNQ